VNWISPPGNAEHRGEIVQVRFTQHHGPAFIAYSCLLLAVCACSSDSTELKMTGLDRRHELQQSFSQAYLCKTEAGDTDIVLVSQGQFAEQNPDKALQPLPEGALPWQIVHIRVYWKPLPGISSDDPTNTNASIRWYLFDDWLHPGGYLEYSGSALVDVDEDEKDASASVQNGWLKVAAIKGDMVDKLGASQLGGEIHARIDPGRVQAVLGMIENQTSPASRAQKPASRRP